VHHIRQASLAEQYSIAEPSAPFKTAAAAPASVAKPRYPGQQRMMADLNAPSTVHNELPLHQEAAEMEAAIEWEDVEYKISTEAAPRAASRKLRARLGLAPRASSQTQTQPQSSSALSDDVVSIEMSSDSDSTAASSSAAPTPSKERTLIHRTSGFMPRAKFIAIMGSSGAGKTTFLNVLSGQLKKDWKSECSGVIRVNGRRLTSQVFQFVSLSLSSSRPLSRPLSLPSFIRLIAVCDAMW